MALPWIDRGRTLTEVEVQELLRDACAVLGKCSHAAAPAAVALESPGSLRFDTPPLFKRPHHQKRSLYYLVVTYFNDANIYIPTDDLGADYFKDHPDSAFGVAAHAFAQAQEHPAR